MAKPKSKPSVSSKPTVAVASRAPKSARQPRARTPKAAAEPALPSEPETKLQTLAALLQRKEGATVEQLMAATGWQAHSVRGALAGAMKTYFGAKVTNEKVDGVRTYRAPQI